MANRLNVTELDFDKIKSNLIAFLKGQDEFNDYNYQGSGMSVLLDLLSYNTHYNAMFGHVDVNENFLTSAQLRHNVVAAASPLGYIPRSALGASVEVDITVNDPIGEPVPTTLDLQRGSRLQALIDGVQYPFTVMETVNTSLTIDEDFQYNNIVIKQGELKTNNYRVDSTVEGQRFIIPDTNVDVSTIRVRVRPHEQSNSYAVYIPFTSFAQVDGTSPIYFLEEGSTGEYAVYFGDGIVGNRPGNNNIVEIQYLTTKGAAGNGANSFTFASDVGGNTDISVGLSIPQTQSSGGSDREGIESIRFNAPLTYIAQNRAVTADDYKSILVREYGDIEAISTWGGEDSNPPDYGKVYIAIKPKSGNTLTPLAKTNIRNILRGKNVVSITPVFQDPVFTYLELEVFFKFNPNLTENSQAELQSIVKRRIEQYNTDNLREFNGVFRYSQLTREIDNADPGILNSIVRVYMYKDLFPNPAISNTFELNFAGSVEVPIASSRSITTDAFDINGVSHFIGDEPLNETERRLYVYKIVNDQEVKVIRDVGRFNPLMGTMTIYGLRPDNAARIRVTVQPLSNDIAPRRNQLVQIDSQSLRVVGEVDTIATAGASGAIDYQTTARQ
jgi:hypothetical protein